ncbi:MAG: oxidative damage protection protein [Acidobacteria bacterium]|nr:MAG: oxidative damage protection protein [Acidobacteriota bacterium]
MAQQMVQCAKLGRELPGIDQTTNEGEAAVVFLQSLGSEELTHRVLEHVSLDAWKLWLNHLVMVINEYRLEPDSPEANDIMRQHLEEFFFGAHAVPPPGYIPPPGR